MPERPAFFQGVGLSEESQDDADRKALVFLASSMMVEVKAGFKEEIRGTWVDGMVRETGTVQMISATKTDQEIEGAKVIKRWYDKGRKTYWAYAEVDKKISQHRIQERIRRLLEFGNPRFIVEEDLDEISGRDCFRAVQRGITEALTERRLQVVDPGGIGELNTSLERRGIEIPLGPEGRDYLRGMVADFTVFYSCRSEFSRGHAGDNFIYCTTNARAKLVNNSLGRVVAEKNAEETERDLQSREVAREGSCLRAGREVGEALFSESIREVLDSPRLNLVVIEGISFSVLEEIRMSLEDETGFIPQVRSYQNRTAFLEVYSQLSLSDVSSFIGGELTAKNLPYDLEIVASLLHLTIH